MKLTHLLLGIFGLLLILSLLVFIFVPFFSPIRLYTGWSFFMPNTSTIEKAILKNRQNIELKIDKIEAQSIYKALIEDKQSFVGNLQMATSNMIIFYN